MYLGLTLMSGLACMACGRDDPPGTPLPRIEPSMLPMTQENAILTASRHFHVDADDPQLRVEDSEAHWIVWQPVPRSGNLEPGPSFTTKVYVNKATGEIDKVEVGS